MMNMTPAQPYFGCCVTTVDLVAMRLVLDVEFCGRPEVLRANRANRVIKRRVGEVPRFGGIARSYPPCRPHQRCALHQWLETKRKRKLEAHEVFSEDPALYRWQCWASTCEDPNSKDSTFVEDPRFRAFDSKVGFNYTLESFLQG